MKFISKFKHTKAQVVSFLWQFTSGRNDMLQKVFEVTLEKVPAGVELNHPLHIGINKALIHILIRENSKLDETGFIGALMREFPVLFNTLECFFVQVQIVETFMIVNEEDIPLYVTEDFLNHYSFSYGEKCYFKSVVCHILEKIVLGAKSTGSYAWFQDFKDLKRHNDLVVACCNKRFLCRQGDVLLVDPSKDSNKVFSHLDYVTLDCQPFRQGLITLNSSLVIVDLRDVSGVNERSGKHLVNSIDVISLSKYALGLINYTSSNFLGVRFPNTVSTASYTSLNTMKFLFSFEIRVISKLNIHFEKELSKVKKDIDPLNTVFVSCTIGKKLHLISGSWVKINILEQTKIKVRSPVDPVVTNFQRQSSEIKTLSCETRLAQVCCFSDEKASSHYFPSDKIVYISPHLWFNLNRQPSLLVQPHLRLQIEPMEVGFSPPLAEEAHAALIQSPNYDGKINCQTMLSKYFNIPRFICKGDIFSTDSRDQYDFHAKIQDEDHDKLKWPAVYFRISNVECPESTDGYLMSNQNTRLYQVGTKQSYVPLTMETYYLHEPSHPIWDSIPEGLSNYITHLQDLILPFLKLQSEKSHLSCNILFSGPPCCGKTTVIKAVCKSLNLHLYQVNCHELVGEISAVVEAKLKNKILKGKTYAPCVILLKNIHLVGKERETVSEDFRVIHLLANQLKNVNQDSVLPVVIIGTTTEKLNNDLVSSFLHTVQMTAPSEEERSLLLQDLLTVCDVGNDVSTCYLAQRTAGFVLGDLCALVNQAIRNAYRRLRKFVGEKGLSSKEEEDIILASVPIVQKDLINALETLQSKFAEAIGAPKIPDVKFEDIGGLAQVKQEILDTIQLPLEHPEILFSGLRRSGVLLYGPPGSGKTMLAKAVATECSLNFLSVKGPELINMYVGQSEENVRAVFSQARSAVPCIIFFDELDSLAPNRGRSGDSGGVMDRVVSQLLAELDGLNKKSEVFVIGATNRPDLIDPALLRPGRFDRLLYVGIPEDKRSKLNILKALTRKIPLASNVKLEEIIKECPPHLSGADFYSLCTNAVITRVEKNVDMIEKGEKTMDELNNEVQTEDFLCAMKTLVPSVSPEIFEQYKALKLKIEKE
ncbi:UNVERIFIED_CONTAM: Peroxisome assembly factor 2 [Trichonephila clavipes]